MQSTSQPGSTVFAFRPAAPLDVWATLARHTRWGEDPANVVRDGSLYRVLAADDGLVPFRLQPGGTVDHPRMTVEYAGPDRPELRRRLRWAVGRLVGDGLDLAGFYAWAADDPILGPLVARDGGLRGYRPTLVPDEFEMLIGAICAQQVHLAVAFALRTRLVRRFGTPCTLAGVTVHAFPAPAVLAGVSPAVLRELGYSGRKAEYVVALAGEVTSGRLDLRTLAAADDEEVVARLTSVRGLGRWTAEWFLCRGLGRPDVCPADDLGVRRAVEAFCLGRRADAGQVRHRARAWRPHRSLAVHYLLAAHARRVVGPATRHR